MPLPRMRFTVRRMMVAVAVAAVFTGAAMRIRAWHRLSRDRYQMAFRMRMASQTEIINARATGAEVETLRKSIAGARGSEQSLLRAAIAEAERRQQAYQRSADHRRWMAEKYERAARHLFLPVPPDPPDPE